MTEDQADKLACSEDLCHHRSCRCSSEAQQARVRWTWLLLDSAVK